MPGGVGVFGAERWAEGVHVGHGLSKDFRLKLAAYRQEGGPAKEIGVVIDPSALGRQVVKVQGSGAEHRAGALGVAGGDDRRLDVEEAALLEELVNAKGHCVAHAGHGAEGIGAWAEMGQLPQKLQGVPLLLQRILLRICAAQHRQAAGDHLVLLAAPEGFLQHAEGCQAASGGQAADEGVIGAIGIDDDLQVGQARPVVDLDKGNAAPKIGPS